MAKTLSQILGFRTLLGLINDPRGSIPADVMPLGFTSRANARRVRGNTGTYLKVAGTRQTARLVQYGSPSVRRTMKDVTEVPVVLMHAYEHQQHRMAVLEAIRSYADESAQNMGQQEVDRQVRDFRQYFNNLQLAAIYSVFANGAIYFDGEGNLLPTSSGAVTTVDFSVPAGNKNQLDIEGTGAIIGASWATASTGIIQDIQDIADALERKFGYRPAHAFYGSNIRGYLIGNTQVKDILTADPVMAAAFRQGGIPQGFGLAGLSWHPGSRMFFADAAGTTQTFVGGDVVIFTPEPSMEWWDWIDGSFTIPNALGNVYDDATDALAAFETVFGMFSYASITDDPPGIKHFAGDTFLPCLKVPGAIAIGDMTP